MKLVLKRPTEMYPAGQGFGFVEPKTGMRFNGLHSNPQGTALKIIDHRRANPKLFTDASDFDVENTVQQIYQQKLQTMPELFIGFGGEPTQMFPDASKCNCGGKESTPVYCKSCGGHRIVAYKCSSCGLERGSP